MLGAHHLGQSIDITKDSASLLESIGQLGFAWTALTSLERPAARSDSPAATRAADSIQHVWHMDAWEPPPIEAVVAAFSRHFLRFCELTGRNLTQRWLRQVPPLFRIDHCPSVSAEALGRACLERCEPLYPHLRNTLFVEFDINYAFLPYAVVPSFERVPLPHGARVVLLDVGTNGFLASAKHLIDLYEPHLPFTDAILFEPHPEGMEPPAAYAQRLNISVRQHAVDVGTRRPPHDLLEFIPRTVTRVDFVVLKFDVDEGTSGDTMEWGFLADLVHSDALAYVDEIFIEARHQYPPICAYCTHMRCPDATRTQITVTRSAWRALLVRVSTHPLYLWHQPILRKPSTLAPHGCVTDAFPMATASLTLEREPDLRISARRVMGAS